MFEEEIRRTEDFGIHWYWWDLVVNLVVEE